MSSQVESVDRDTVHLRRALLVRGLPEWCLAALVVAGFLWHVQWFFAHGYIRQPFLNYQFDTWMDWFNAAFWGSNNGRYEVWKSVYPPMSFALFDFITIGRCYEFSPVSARDCDWLSRYLIVAFYCLCVVAAGLAFRKNDRANWIPRASAFAVGLPLLFTFERGNLMIIAFPFYVVAFGPVIFPKWIRAMSIAVTVNFKPYLIVPVLGLAIKRQWRLAELSAIATIALYLLSLAYIADGLPNQIIDNTRDFVQQGVENAFGQIYYSTSYAPFMVLIESGFPLKQYIGSSTIDFFSTMIPLVLGFTLALSFVALAAAWVQPRSVNLARVSAICLGTYLAMQTPGGYVFIFLLFLVFLERWEGLFPILAIVLAYILSIPYDYILAPIGSLQRVSWLSGFYVSNTFGMSVGQFLRPFLAILIVWALSADTIIRSIKFHRQSRPSLWLSINRGSAVRAGVPL